VNARRSLAATGAAVALVAAGVVGGSALSSSSSTTTTIAAAVPACTLVNTFGTIADPCTQELAKWEQEFRNGLATNAYYPKWRAANPGEYGRLRTWGTSSSTTPQPIVATGYGAVVRYGLAQCRTWAVDLARCVLP